jgi:hypothetical protein
MLLKDKRYMINTLILCLVWSTGVYSFYFTEFYMKYVPVGNIYYLAMLLGLSDLLTCFSFNLFIQCISSIAII